VESDLEIEPLKAKIVRDKERFRREQDNYTKIVGSTTSRNELFVKIQRFEERNGVIMMEAGDIDLKRLSDLLGPIRGKSLKILASRMVNALSVVHSKGLVWTDLKLENFVLASPSATSTTSYPPSSPLLRKDVLQQRILSKEVVCKAIDLESAVKKGNPLVDFSPETAAPELCEILSNGQLSVGGGRGKSDFTLGVTEPLIASQALDVWALGISILQLYLGSAPVVDRPDTRQSCMKLARYVAGTDDLGLGVVMKGGKDDVWLYRLLKSMLNPDPSKRSSLSGVQKSIYLNLP
jgi:serine/threonine protein kinase